MFSRTSGILLIPLSVPEISFNAYWNTKLSKINETLSCQNTFDRKPSTIKNLFQCNHSSHLKLSNNYSKHISDALHLDWNQSSNQACSEIATYPVTWKCNSCIPFQSVSITSYASKDKTKPALSPYERRKIRKQDIVVSFTLNN